MPPIIGTPNKKVNRYSGAVRHQSGRRILAKLDDGTVLFRAYMQEDGRRWLKPLNPQHPPTFDRFVVLGTVVSTYNDNEDDEA